jgi:cystathionine beta-lyase/cystathionine gamma-synthase
VTAPAPGDQRQLATFAVHGAHYATPVNAPASMPIYASAAWTFDDLDQLDRVLTGIEAGVNYGSFGVPNHDALETLAAGLEHAETAVATAGGMTAIFAALSTILRSGDHVIASHNLFGPTLGVLTDLERFDITVSFVNAGDVQEVERTLCDRTRVVYVETLSNPRLRAVDLPALACRAHDARALVLVDNTFASPALFRPLDHGADLVIESLTKFVSGHYDALAGLVAGRDALVEPIRRAAIRNGWLCGPFEAWLTIRGAQTLDVRVRRAEATAAALADWLSEQPMIDAVHYPAHRNHPDHEVAARLFGPDRGGTMLTIDLEGGRSAVNALLRGMRDVRLVTSLGGTATTVNHPYSTTHRDVGDDIRERSEIHPGLVRIAVGLEALDDIRADFARGLATLSSRTVRGSVS